MAPAITSLAEKVKQPTLPTPAELKEAFNSIMDAIEAVDRIAQRVFEVTNFEGEQQVTLEQIGALCAFVGRAQQFVGFTEGYLSKIELAAKIDLSDIQQDGRMDGVPQFDSIGTPNYPVGGAGT